MRAGTGDGGRRGAVREPGHVTALPPAPDECYVLKLYVTGMTRRSRAAISNIKAICEEHLAGRYDLEVIDLFARPYVAKDEQIIAAPTLVKRLPAPLRRFVGDLSNSERILLGFGLRRRKKS